MTKLSSKKPVPPSLVAVDWRVPGMIALDSQSQSRSMNVRIHLKFN